MSNFFRRWFSGRPAPVRTRTSRSPRSRMMLLALEGRITPATFTVLNANDAGAGSLRDALTQANATSAADAINFDPTFFSSPRTIALATALPDVEQDVSFNGPGAGNLTVQSTGTFRVFLVDIDGKTGNVTVSGMTLSGGTAPAAEIGGNIFTDENLTILDSVITGGTSALGGGVGTATYAALTIRNSTISGNNSTGSGGGIAVNLRGSLRLSGSTVSGNTAAASGGGVYLYGQNSALVEGSTISGNTADGANGGGGLYTFGQPDASGIVVRNTTIAGNAATGGDGGGIVIQASAGFGLVNPISLQNVTVVNNTASGNGGGIARSTGNGNLNLTSTVVAFNTATAGTNDAFFGTGTGNINANNSLVRDQTGLPAFVGTGNLAAGTDPSFVGGATPTLANNGGPVQTVALQSTSPLINAGLNAAAVGIDARGNGFPRTVGASADIGAFEFSPTVGLPSALATAADVLANGATTYTFTVTYTDVAGTTVGINTGSFGNDDVTVTFTDATGATIGAPVAATFVSNSGNVATYSVTPPGGSFDAADYGRVRIAVNANAVTDLDGNAVNAVTAGTARVATPATFTVTNTADTGAGSLRQALTDANNRAFSLDNVVFQAGVTGTIALATGLGIFDPVTITGPGAANLTVAGNNTFRLVGIVMEGSQVVNISGLTFTGGNSGTSVVGGAGLFLSNETVTLDGVVVSNNTAPSGPGGGINNTRGGTVTIRNSTITGNSATSNANTTGDGGGINFAAGGSTVLIENSTIAGNTAGFSGGGISDRTGGIVTVRNSTVSGNTAAQAGGGFYMGYNGSALIEGSTLSGNSAGFEGGGFYFFGVTDPNGLVIRNSTIAGNTATENGGGIGLAYFGYDGASGTSKSSTLLVQNSTIAGNTAGGVGGGFADTNPGNAGNTVSLESTVIANNTGTTGSPDVAGVAGSNGGTPTINATRSLVRDQTGASLPNYGSQNNLAAGTNPSFVGGATPTLANNGGPTQTIALQAGSPLLNAGSNPAALATDQRGAGFARTSGTGTDIGSFEVQVATAPRVTAVTVNAGQSNATQRSRVTSIDVTFSSQVTFAGAVAAAFQLSRIGGGAVGGFTATANVVGGVTVVTLSGFTGAETTSGSLNDGRYQLVALANQITSGGQQLDGDGNGTGGDNFTQNGTTGNGLFRFFGDVNGDGTDNAADFAQFRTAFGTATGNPLYRDYLDFNFDGSINAADFAQFRTRFGASVP